jgi:hypothetical protein
MKGLYILCLSLNLISTYGKILKDLQSYSFDKFVNDFGYVGLSEQEYNFRKRIFEQEIERVIKHNAMNYSWKEGINKFSAMTNEEKRKFYGFSKNANYFHKQKRIMEQIQKSTTFDVMPNNLPTSIDWRDHGVATAVKDQGHCGSCWSVVTYFHRFCRRDVDFAIKLILSRIISGRLHRLPRWSLM